MELRFKSDLTTIFPIYLQSFVQSLDWIQPLKALQILYYINAKETETGINRVTKGTGIGFKKFVH